MAYCRFGVQVEQASPSQLRRMRNMKQGKINFNKGATRKKKKKSRDHGEAESEEDEDAEMREAKKQSLLTARKEEEQRKKSGGRNANSDDDDFKTTPVKKGVPKRPVVSVADFVRFLLPAGLKYYFDGHILFAGQIL